MSCRGVRHSWSMVEKPQVVFMVMQLSQGRPGTDAVTCCSGVSKSSGSSERSLIKMFGCSSRTRALSAAECQSSGVYGQPPSYQSTASSP